MLTGDIGETAQLAKTDRLSTANLTLFRPVRSMLAIPEPSANAVWNRVQSEFTAQTALAEAKYDGIRAQLHGTSDRTELFSRDLRNLSEEFPELAALRFAEDLILDGEVVAFGPDRKLSFFDLQRRLGRKRTLDFFETEDIPVLYMVFDLLRLNGETLLKAPLSERRRRLDQLTLPNRVKVSPIRKVASLQEIDEAYRTARKDLQEGLMIKDADSLYTPGRRGGSWIKFKIELATLDVVVVGVEQGHGKRSHLLSDYTFSVRDEETGTLQTIGKAYSGLRDEEIEELTEHFLRTTTRKERHFRVVIPEIILEVAFNAVQPSDRHSSGLALRFPRIKSIRRDKKIARNRHRPVRATVRAKRVSRSLARSSSSWSSSSSCSCSSSSSLSSSSAFRVAREKRLRSSRRSKIKAITTTTTSTSTSTSRSRSRSRSRRIETLNR